MKKILLIDNVTNRLNNFNINHYQNYADILIAEEKIIKDKDNLYPQFNDIAALLLHKNYYEEGEFKPAHPRIKYFTNIEGIALVLFSGEQSDSTDDVIQQNVFYNNLPSFIDHYKSTGEIITEILKYGKLYFLEDPLKLRAKIFKELFEQERDKPLQLSKDLLNNITKLLSILKYSDEQVSQSVHKLKGEYSVESFIDKVDILIQKTNNEHISF